MAKNFIFDTFGLNDIKEYININRINKDLARGVNEAVLSLHSALREKVAQNYNFKHSLDSVLIGKSISNVKQGKNFITAGFGYKAKFIGLSKFSHDSFVGNINPGAQKPGRVERVVVRKGRKSIVYGKQHHGGFIPRYGNLKNPGNAKLFGGHGARMLERLGSSRFPVRMLFGPTLASAALHIYSTDRDVQRKIDEFENTILKFI
jgi:hypothetical protein